MRVLRALLIVAVFAGAAFLAYRWLYPRPVTADTVTVYYAKTDGETLVPWKVTLGSARDRKSVAFYAVTQVLAGPPADTEAVRFPPGTTLRSLQLTGDTATVDLSSAVGSQPGGSLSEGAEFKALVWTLTALPGISKVQVEVAGAKVPTLPGGHFELDEPLARSTF
jgi:N-acetylmuramoyl-L-alanine amidase